MGGWCEGLKTTKKGDGIMKHFFIGIDISKQDFHLLSLRSETPSVREGKRPQLKICKYRDKMQA